MRASQRSSPSPPSQSEMLDALTVSATRSSTPGITSDGASPVASAAAIWAIACSSRSDAFSTSSNEESLTRDSSSRAGVVARRALDERGAAR